MVNQNANFTIRVQHGAGAPGGAGAMPPGMPINAATAAGALGTGGGSPGQQQQNFLKTLFEFEAIKGVLTEMKNNSKIANTYLGTMGKIFGAAMDILLIPFIPILNLVMIGMTKLIEWLVTSGTLAAISNGVQNLIKKGEELITWVKGIINTFDTKGIIAATEQVGKDIVNAIVTNLPKIWPKNLKDAAKDIGVGGLALGASGVLGSVFGGMPLVGGILGAPFNIAKGIAGGLFGGGGGGGAAAGAAGAGAAAARGGAGASQVVAAPMSGGVAAAGAAMTFAMASLLHYQLTGGNIFSGVTGRPGTSPVDSAKEVAGAVGSFLSSLGKNFQSHPVPSNLRDGSASNSSGNNQVNSGNTINQTFNITGSDPNAVARQVAQQSAQTGYAVATRGYIGGT